MVGSSTRCLTLRPGDEEARNLQREGQGVIDQLSQITRRDAVMLEADRPSRTLECSYCDTALEVSARGPDSVRFTVQVAEGPA